MRIGIVKEGFTHPKGDPKGDPKVGDSVKQAVQRLTSAGAVVEEMSIPLHAKASAFWNMFGMEGSYDTILRQNSSIVGLPGFYPTSSTKYQAAALSTRINELSQSMKLVLLFGEYLKDNYPGQFYSRGMNMRRHLTREYEDALEKYDVVAMPTIPMTATKLLTKEPSVLEYIADCFGNVSNTMAASVTGMPALTVNAGFIDGLPVGTMFTGKKFDEVTLFKVGHIFEKLNKKAE